MAIPRYVRKRLPKARLLSIEWGGYYDKPYWARFRGANFMRWQLWCICVHHRMPWIEEVARINHPHLFKRRTRPDTGER